jgi:hypothetical protein
MTRYLVQIALQCTNSTQAIGALSTDSRYFKTTDYPDIDPGIACRVAKEYGELIGFHADDACGYKDSQMLMGFHHNTPDNTLPIMWADNTAVGGSNWAPIFKRYPKYLGDSL